MLAPYNSTNSARFRYIFFWFIFQWNLMRFFAISELGDSFYQPIIALHHFAPFFVGAVEDRPARKFPFIEIAGRLSPLY